MLGTLNWRVRSYIAANGVPVLPEHIVAVGLLTREDVRLLGPTFQRLWPVSEHGNAAPSRDPQHT